MIHYKDDLYTDNQLLNFKTVIGDLLSLDVPDGTGNFVKSNHIVVDITKTDLEKDGVHYTLVSLTLDSEQPLTIGSA